MTTKNTTSEKSVPLSSHTQPPNNIACKASAKEQKEKIWSSLVAHNCNNETKEEKNTNSTTTCPKQRREWPTYDVLARDIGGDYGDTLRCPHDLRFLSGQSGKTKQKILCPHGVVCTAKLELFPLPTSTQVPGQTCPIAYSGLLKPGTTVEHCILRLSSAMRPPHDELQSKLARAMLYAAGDKVRNAKLFPCASLKAFRGDGMHSGNLLFAGCKVGQREEDFFAHCLCTQVTEQMPMALKPFVKKFWTYSDYPLSLGVSDWCIANQNGELADPYFPFALVLSPSHRLTGVSVEQQEGGEDDNKACTTADENIEQQSSFDAFIDNATEIPCGTTLYDVFACPNPSVVPDPSKLERIGRVVTTSEMIPSGKDDGLFFRHQRKEEDYALRPNWKRAIKAQCTIHNGKRIGSISKIAGWRLFEEHIAKAKYLDYEVLAAEEIRVKE